MHKEQRKNTHRQPKYLNKEWHTKADRDTLDTYPRLANPVRLLAHTRGSQVLKYKIKPNPNPNTYPHSPYCVVRFIVGYTVCMCHGPPCPRSCTLLAEACIGGGTYRAEAPPKFVSFILLWQLYTNRVIDPSCLQIHPPTTVPPVALLQPLIIEYNVGCCSRPPTHLPSKWVGFNSSRRCRISPCCLEGTGCLVTTWPPSPLRPRCGTAGATLLAFPIWTGVYGKLPFDAIFIYIYSL